MNRIEFGDCRDTMRAWASQGVKAQTCVTSPPYFALRDYGHPGQIGLEQTPEQYVSAMVEVFRCVRDVLADDGTLWLNIGDSYCSTAPGTRNAPQTKGSKTEAGQWANARPKTPDGMKPKDLIGIPWMLAFALRQPFEKVHIKDRIDRAWLAALVDGEGCMTVMEANNGEKTATSFPPILQVKMCDPECVEHANDITGFKQCLRQDSPSRGGKRETFQWRIAGRRAADIVAEIYPYLRIKRKQAVILWNHQLVRDSYETKRGQPMPVSAREKQQQCRELIQRLNQKQDVDIPSWMIEPKVTVEPGWYLRQDVIWSKPNPMPESVRDRCTKAHEYVFLLSKSERYFFDSEAMKEPAVGNASGAAASFKRSGSKREQTIPGQGYGTHRPEREDVAYNETRNRRSVWTVATRPYKGAHFATFPPALIEPCILAGSRPGDVVLDPFMGSGTTAAVALQHGRQYLGCELNPEYGPLQVERIAAAEAEFVKQFFARWGATK
jgi:DNA modification methylase